MALLSYFPSGANRQTPPFLLRLEYERNLDLRKAGPASIPGCASIPEGLKDEQHHGSLDLARDYE